MLDFFYVKTREVKGEKDMYEVYPNFIVGRSEHLMVRGGAFYAIWDEKAGLWSTDEYQVQKLVDQELDLWMKSKADPEKMYTVKYMRNFDSGQWAQFQRFVKNISDNEHTLDDSLIFYDQETGIEDYATKKLSYPLSDSFPESWNEIVGTLYSPEERQKIEWAIGAIFSGDSKFIQKFVVFQGPPGTGKSTIMDVISGLFEGYTATFDAKALGSSNAQFSTAVFKSNPLVAIQQDGDLSRIDDNTKLNSIISHEDVIINEKNKPAYPMKINAFLFMGTNGAVKISDAKSGLIRRLIDVEPTGNLFDYGTYKRLTTQVKFEYGAIAKHCIQVYEQLGESYYNDYRPIEMMYKTDHFLNFVSDNHLTFSTQNYTTSTQAYALYKLYCEEDGIDKPLQRQKFQNELSNYFDVFHSSYINEKGERLRSVYTGFNFEKYRPKPFQPDKNDLLKVMSTESIFDKEYSEAPAQYATSEGIPKQKWADVTTKLSDVNTREIHYVKVPENHIIIDFDKKVNGEKNLDANLRAALKWPETYAELSKSGQGVHLHYIYDGDPNLLESVYDTDIEIKVYKGNSSLRRKLTYCNDKPIAHISSGLPIKEEKKMLESKVMTSDKSVRDLVIRNLRKDIHPGTKPSVNFIRKILDDAYESGMTYDLTDMRPAITTFAAQSTNHGLECLKMVKEMKFKSDGFVTESEKKEDLKDEKPLVVFDLEVYSNFFGISWKYVGSDMKPVRMINPTPQEVESLFDLKLVGFNNRRYDNHILYARYMGYDNENLYKLSQRIIGKDRGAYFGAAWNLSYTDIFDYSSKKQSLKKWEFELGVPHVEMDIPWNEPVPEHLWDKVMDYCDNDVLATEAVFNHTQGDWMARQILADLSGLSVNHTTQNHTAKIVFGDDDNPQRSFVYTDLATGQRTDGTQDIVKFPGYKFDMGKSTYRGVEVGEGGYVYAEPGMYENVVLLDVASLHPNSIRNLNLFGQYNKNFTDLVDARVAIKHSEFDKAAKMLNGKLAPYLEKTEHAEELAYALKIVINIVYGLTSAKFDNKFRDNRNKDNIVAKRGALFMIDLQKAVEERGFTVAHVKTDSIKIPNATPEIIDFVMEFGKKYGYDFEHEATYEKFCLVNDAVYIAKYGWAEKKGLEGQWTATGAQFQHPYVFKKLFTHEKIELKDLVEKRSVQKGHIWLKREGQSNYFVGKASQLLPVREGHSLAATAVRIDDESGKEFAVPSTKGYYWTVAEDISDISEVDMGYYEDLVDAALANIRKFGSYDELTS